MPTRDDFIRAGREVAHILKEEQDHVFLIGAYANGPGGCLCPIAEWGMKAGIPPEVVLNADSNELEFFDYFAQFGIPDEHLYAVEKLWDDAENWAGTAEAIEKLCNALEDAR